MFTERLSSSPGEGNGYVHFDSSDKASLHEDTNSHFDNGQCRRTTTVGC